MSKLYQLPHQPIVDISGRKSFVPNKIVRYMAEYVEPRGLSYQMLKGLAGHTFFKSHHFVQFMELLGMNVEEVQASVPHSYGSPYKPLEDYFATYDFNDNNRELPMQPIIIDEVGTARFVKNEVIAMVYNWAHVMGYTLNDVAVDLYEGKYSKEDMSQFSQLIGYSVSGFGDLSTSIPEQVERADKEVERILFINGSGPR